MTEASQDRRLGEAEGRASCQEAHDGEQRQARRDARVHERSIAAARARVLRQEQAIAHLASCGRDTVRARKRLAEMCRALDVLLRRRHGQQQESEERAALHAGQWCLEADGVVAAAVGTALRLVVHPPCAAGGYARFLVLDRRLRGGTATHALLASGSEESVSAAMRAAERAAARIALFLP